MTETEDQIMADQNREILHNMTYNGGSAKKGGNFTTYTGIMFNPIDPIIDKINIKDIAQALSNICRFGGHVTEFYCVAQHSVYVSQLCDPKDALFGLLHDAAEAYIGDMVRPLKYTDSMQPFRDVEEHLEKTIAHRFGLTSGIDTFMPASVKAADDVLVVAEALRLFNPKPKWALDTLSIRPHPFQLQDIWSPKFAKSQFMLRFLELTGAIKINKETNGQEN